MVEAIAEQRQKPLSLNASLSPLSLDELFYGQSAGVGHGRPWSRAINLDDHRESPDDLLKPSAASRGACKLGRDDRAGAAREPPAHAGGLRDFSV